MAANHRRRTALLTGGGILLILGLFGVRLPWQGAATGAPSGCGGGPVITAAENEDYGTYATQASALWWDDLLDVVTRGCIPGVGCASDVVDLVPDAQEQFESWLAATSGALSTSGNFLKNDFGPEAGRKFVYAYENRYFIDEQMEGLIGTTCGAAGVVGVNAACTVGLGFLNDQVLGTAYGTLPAPLQAYMFVDQQLYGRMSTWHEKSPLEIALDTAIIVTSGADALGACNHVPKKKAKAACALATAHTSNALVAVERAMTVVNEATPEAVAGDKVEAVLLEALDMADAPQRDLLRFRDPNGVRLTAIATTGGWRVLPEGQGHFEAFLSSAYPNAPSKHYRLIENPGHHDVRLDYVSGGKPWSVRVNAERTGFEHWEPGNPGAVHPSPWINYVDWSGTSVWAKIASNSGRFLQFKVCTAADEATCQDEPVTELSYRNDLAGQHRFSALYSTKRGKWFHSPAKRYRFQTATDPHFRDAVTSDVMTYVAPGGAHTCARILEGGEDIVFQVGFPAANDPNTCIPEPVPPTRTLTYVLGAEYWQATFSRRTMSWFHVRESAGRIVPHIDFVRGDGTPASLRLEEDPTGELRFHVSAASGATGPQQVVDFIGWNDEVASVRPRRFPLVEGRGNTAFELAVTERAGLFLSPTITYSSDGSWSARLGRAADGTLEFTHSGPNGASIVTPRIRFLDWRGRLQWARVQGEGAFQLCEDPECLSANDVILDELHLQQADGTRSAVKVNLASLTFLRRTASASETEVLDPWLEYKDRYGQSGRARLVSHPNGPLIERVTEGSPSIGTHLDFEDWRGSIQQAVLQGPRLFSLYVPGPTGQRTVAALEVRTAAGERRLVTRADDARLLAKADAPFALNLHGDRRADGAIVNLWETNGHRSQVWTVRAEDQTIRFGADERFCLNLHGNAQLDGAVVNLWRCNGHDSQKWAVQADGTVHKTSNPAFCLNLHGDARQNGATINLWSCNGHASQRWTTTPVLAWRQSPMIID